VKTVVEVLKLSTSYLQDRKVERARRMAEELLAHTIGMKRMDLYLQYDRPVDERELTSLRDLLKRAGKGEPVAYILGEVPFHGCTIRVDSRVLIPRPETELLVDLILKVNPQKKIWDLCAGSGCIGIALKKARPDLEVVLADVSFEALELASANARLNQVDVACLHGDLFAPFVGLKADLIVSNPPYISPKEYLDLDPSVRDFEPKTALVAQRDGLAFYERIEAEIKPFLAPGGSLWLEIGCRQGAAVMKIFSGKGWKNQKVMQDWAGKDRFFIAEPALCALSTSAS
jgi:release factor glutamine methyltransferase